MIGPAVAVTAVVAGAAAFAVGSSLYSRAKVEKLDYSVTARLGPDMEIRHYPAVLAAEATVPADRGAQNTAFRILYRYITGHNRPGRPVARADAAAVVEKPGRKIAMTAPVETRRVGENTVSLRFFLPGDLTLEVAPEPLDQRVRIVALPARTVAVLRFSGGRSDSALADRRGRLAAAVADGSGWQVDGDPLAFFYDPPFVPPALRRNEVAFPVVADATRADDAAA